MSRKNLHRTLFVNVRLSVAEKRRLELAAESYKQSLSAWARQILLRAAGKHASMRRFR